MNDVDLRVFDALFREACQKCFGHPIAGPLTETDSRLMHARIFEDTGLVIGWKSIKNYSLHVLSTSAEKSENPSVATLDTLARYVSGAAYTTEPERKKEAGHYPHWYEYKSRWMQRQPAPLPPQVQSPRIGSRFGWKIAIVSLVALAALIIAIIAIPSTRSGERAFATHFRNVSSDSLQKEGWWVANPDTEYWNRRAEAPGCLTLYTLRGDNWRDSANKPVIKNLLIHRIDCDCWTAEIHLKDFVPVKNWQQAGILLMEDTGFKGASMRVSIAYNDYNGIYPRSGSILVQGVASRGDKEDKPEEFAHVVILQTDSATRHPDLYQTLSHAAIRVEKNGDYFRILYADGISETTAFKEVSSHAFSFRPRFVGLFALRGNVDSPATAPARITYFALDCCKML